MKPHRRSIPAIVYPILLAAGVVGEIATRRYQEAGAGKLPEDLTGTLQKEVAAENNPALDRFYRQSGYAPVWQHRRPEVVTALLGSTNRGLKPGDYFTSQSDIALTKGLMQYAADLRFGHANPGLYGKPDRTALGDLAWSVAHDPAGVESGLDKLDPPFAEYRRLKEALGRVGPEERARIEQTMERWRWLPRNFPNGAILVNVPEYRLRAYDQNNNVALEMKTIVGQVKHQTPLFTGDIKYLVFGPYWNVPASILKNEIVPDIVKDRAYLDKNDYEVVDSKGKVIAGEEVSDEVLDGLQSGAFRVRQVPGRKNALGRVKFMFPNQNDVYLHDTSSPRLFAREQRALSHGCVRVENPQALAEWVLRNESEWDKDRIANAFKDSKPQQVNVTRPIPVYLVYHTATVSEDGAVHVWKDVYKQEATTVALAPRPRE
ncbi:MAG: L,D-transpeptidase family protein [Bryobacteraceae bacterium]